MLDELGSWLRYEVFLLDISLFHCVDQVIVLKVLKRFETDAVLVYRCHLI
jgi:hypothetical protein